MNEFAQVPIDCYAPVLDATVSGTIDTSAISDVARVTVDNQTITGLTNNSGSYSVSIPPGTQDLIATVEDEAGNTLAVHTLSNVTVPSGGISGQDFTFSASDLLGAQATTTFTNLPSAAVNLSSSIAYFGSLSDRFAIGGGNESSVTYDLIPSQDIGANSVYDVRGYLTLLSPTDVLSVDVYGTSPPTSIAYPNALTVANPTNTDTPQFTFNYTGFSSMSGGQMYYELEETLASTNFVEAVVTPGYLSATGGTYAVSNVNPSGGAFPPTVGSSGELFQWYVFAEYVSPGLLASLGPYYFTQSSSRNGHPQSLLIGKRRANDARLQQDEDASSISGFAYVAGFDGVGGTFLP